MQARILVVDDEPDLEELIRQKFRRQIRKGTIEFVFTGNGREALDRLRQDESVDLVLSDINMPEMDGLTLLQKIQDAYPVLKSVVISAYGDLANIRTAMNRGAFDFLTKPIDLTDLEITVNKALQYVEESRDKVRLQQEKLELELRNRFIRTTFGRYVSTEVAESLLESPEALRLGGERREVTILMSDPRGFSSASERREPEQVVTLLNRYFGAMVDVITAYEGTIDELIGDAILAIFGAPVWREDHARRAVACAVAMQLAMAEVNEHNRSDGLPSLEMGIGINTGEVVVGNVGSLKRTKYGVVGRHVNLASRIESCTVGGQILVSEATLQEAGPILDVRDQIEVEAKGFERPTTVYDIRGIAGEHDLFLCEKEDRLLPLDHELPVQCALVEGKLTSGDSFAADIVKLSTRGGELRADHSIAPLSTLRLRIRDVSGEDVPGDVYAKVLSRTDGSPSAYHIHFTSVAPEAYEFVRGVVAAAASMCLDSG